MPDTHVPHESVEAWGVLLAAAKKLKPHVIVVLGDFADVESLSAHDKPNGRRVFLAEELPLVRARLRELEGLGAGELIYVMGNHEYRLERYIAKHAPELDGITSWDALLGLGKWKVVPYNESYRIGKLWLTHTTGEAGDNAHRAAARTFMGSAMIGHTHRMGYEVRGKMGGAPYLAAMLGWLGDPAKAKYMHDAKAATHWVNGFGVGYMEPCSGIVHVQPIPIIKGRACFNGEIIAAATT